MRLYPLPFLLALMACNANDDADGDGFPSAVDCDDDNAEINPFATEACDGADNNCDGSIDENPVGGTEFFADLDGDGAGGSVLTITACAAPEGYVAAATDCDDLDKTAFPGAPELCDGVDNNCNSELDEGAGSVHTYFIDADGDSYGVDDETVEACALPAGYAANSFDCNDDANSAFPGAPEVCDDIDNDCDGYIDDADDSLTEGVQYFRDADGDGFGSTPGNACSETEGWSSESGDCDDANPNANPGKPEICDAANVDEDCDGRADDLDDNATGKSTYYPDIDSDGFGDAEGASVALCDPGLGWSLSHTDCDDVSATTHPGASEIENTADDDCDSFCDEDTIEPGDLVITEVMLDRPANYSCGYIYDGESYYYDCIDEFVLDDRTQWFEVYNTTDHDIRWCSGWKLESDSETPEIFPIESNRVINAKSHWVFGTTDDLGANGSVPVDMSYDGALYLETEAADAIRVTFNGTLIDGIAYDREQLQRRAVQPVMDWAYLAGYGETIQLDPRSYDAATNDEMGDGDWDNWCETDDSSRFEHAVPYTSETFGYYNDAYWYGTPGEPNAYCGGSGSGSGSGS